MIKSYRILTVLFLGLIISGCDRVLSSEPIASDLVGSYFLTSNSKEFLKKRKKYAPAPQSMIILDTNYSVSIVNLPDCAIHGFGKSNGKFLSGKGTWEITKSFIGYGLNINIQAGDSLKQGRYLGPWISIRNRSKPYILELTIGDPDSGETIRYENI